VLHSTYRLASFDESAEPVELHKTSFVFVTMEVPLLSSLCLELFWLSEWPLSLSLAMLFPATNTFPGSCVVSVLFSLITEMGSTGPSMIILIFGNRWETL